VNKLTEAQRDQDLCNEGRTIRLLEKLEQEFQVCSNTRQKWFAALLKAAAWRAHMLKKANEQTDEIKERIRALESLESHWSKFKTYLYKKKTKERRIRAKSVEERIEEGNWCSTTEWKEAVERASEPFAAVVEKAKAGPPGSLSNADYAAALNFCLALYFSENRPQRPGFLCVLTLEEWEGIEQTQKYSTRSVKTAGRYGAQTYTFGEHTITAWRLYVQHVRRHARIDPSSSSSSSGDHTDLLFVTVNGSPVQVGRCLNRFSHAMLGKSITPTTLRAIVATEAEGALDEEEAQAIHRGDTHSSATVDEYYDKRAAQRATEAADEAYLNLIKGSPNLPALSRMAVSLELPVNLISEDDEPQPEPEPLRKRVAFDQGSFAPRKKVKRESELPRPKTRRPVKVEDEEWVEYDCHPPRHKKKVETKCRVPARGSPPCGRLLRVEELGALCQLPSINILSDPSPSI